MNHFLWHATYSYTFFRTKVVYLIEGMNADPQAQEAVHDYGGVNGRRYTSMMVRGYKGWFNMTRRRARSASLCCAAALWVSFTPVASSMNHRAASCIYSSLVQAHTHSHYLPPGLCSDDQQQQYRALFSLRVISFRKLEFGTTVALSFLFSN